MADQNNNEQQRQQGGNPWTNLTITGFDDPSQPAMPPLIPQPGPFEGSDPNANPWGTLNTGGFGPAPPRGRGRGARRGSSGQRGSPRGRTRGSGGPPSAASHQGQPPAISIITAVNNLRNPNNIEPGSRNDDGSVTITREWVAQMVGAGHIEQAPSGNLVFARNSAIRNLGVDQDLHEGFMRWMTEEDPDAEHGAGGDAIVIKAEDAKIWFKE
jgi:hypothetical protein